MVGTDEEVGRMRRWRERDNVLVQMRSQRVMERAAAEMTMERARKGVDAAQAVAAVFELKAVVHQGGGAGKEERSQGEGQIEGCCC